MPSCRTDGSHELSHGSCDKRSWRAEIAERIRKDPRTVTIVLSVVATKMAAIGETEAKQIASCEVRLVVSVLGSREVMQGLALESREVFHMKNKIVTDSVRESDVQKEAQQPLSTLMFQSEISVSLFFLCTLQRPAG